MSDEEAIKKDVELGKQLHQRACNQCGARVGWVSGNRYRREHETAKALRAKLAATQDTVERLKQEIEAWIRLNCNSEFTKPWAESLTETLAAALEEPKGEQA